MVLKPLTREGNRGKGKGLGKGVRNHRLSLDKRLKALLTIQKHIQNTVDSQKIFTDLTKDTTVKRKLNARAWVPKNGCGWYLR